MTLAEELQLHCRFMPPPWLRARLVAAARRVLQARKDQGGGGGGSSSSAAAVLASTAYYVAQYLGFEGRQEFWGLALQCGGGWRPGVDRDMLPSGQFRADGSTYRQTNHPHSLASARNSVSPASTAFDPPHTGGGSGMFDGTMRSIGGGGGGGVFASAREERAERYNVQRALADVVDVLCPAPFACPSRLSEALADTAVVRRNKGSLTIQRMHALHLLPLRGIDDSVARLFVARDLINMAEMEKAGEVLLETSCTVPSFAFHAQLAISVAAASQPRPLPTPLVLACKRAGAMLLAKGDVAGAVEKFALIGEHHEACMALQSTGRWMEAAVQARVSPTLSLACKLELLHRWVKSRAQRGEVMAPALLLLRLGSPRAALTLLNESPYTVDMGGLFGLFLALSTLLPTPSSSSTSSRRRAGGGVSKGSGKGQRSSVSLSSYSSALDVPITSPSRPDDYYGSSGSSGHHASSAQLTVRDVVLSVLADYVSLLHSTSNVSLAATVQRVRQTFVA